MLLEDSHNGENPKELSEFLICHELNFYFQDDPELQIPSYQDLIPMMSDGSLVLQMLKKMRFVSSIPHKLPNFKNFKSENWALSLEILRERGCVFRSALPEQLVSGNLAAFLEVFGAFLQILPQIPQDETPGWKYAEKELTAFIKIMPDCVNQLWPFLKYLNYDSDWNDGYLLSHLFNSICLKIAHFLENYINPKMMSRGLFFIERSQSSRDPLKSCIVIEDGKLGIELLEEAISKSQDILNIPRLLEPIEVIEDPCELSMMTYVSYFRDYLCDKLTKNPQIRTNCFTYYHRELILDHIHSSIKHHCIEVLFLLSNSIDFSCLPIELIYLICTLLIRTLLDVIAMCPLCDNDESQYLIWSCSWHSTIFSPLRKKLNVM